MATQKLYDWQALSGKGELYRGEFIATHRQQVYDHLLELGYQPLSLKVRQYLTRYAWRSTQLTPVIHQLGSLLQAGLPLLESLNLMCEPAWRQAIKNCRWALRIMPTATDKGFCVISLSPSKRRSMTAFIDTYNVIQP